MKIILVGRYERDEMQGINALLNSKLFKLYTCHNRYEIIRFQNGNELYHVHEKHKNQFFNDFKDVNIRFDKIIAFPGTRALLSLLEIP